MTCSYDENSEEALRKTNEYLITKPQHAPYVENLRPQDAYIETLLCSIPENSLICRVRLLLKINWNINDLIDAFTTKLKVSFFFLLRISFVLL